MRIVLLSFLLLTACSCVSTREQMVRQGTPPSYIDGYEAGQISGQRIAGNFTAGFSKDVRRYDTDSLYRQGWEDGARMGEGTYQAVHAAMNGY